MFERYSEKSRRVIFFARYEASQYGSPVIESDHLLLGLLRETRLLQHLLKSGPRAIDVLRKEIEKQIVVRPRIPVDSYIPLSSGCTRVLQFAAEESERQSHGYVQPEHLLLGLLLDDQCLGTRVLQAHEVTLSSVREEIKRQAEIQKSERQWCCTDFRARCVRSSKKEEGLASVFVFSSKAGTPFHLEYRRPASPSDPISANGIKLKFCPWCGCDLAEWYKFGLPESEPAATEQA
jgi:ATP-dependent Clp protease ATP-binding subunit ClpA